MNRSEFLEGFKNVLQTDANLSFDTNLEDLEEWDSLSVMSTVAFLDENFNLKLNYAELISFKTVEDVAQKAGI